MNAPPLDLARFDTRHTLCGGSSFPKVVIAQNSETVRICIHIPSLPPNAYSIELEGVVMKIYRDVKFSEAIQKLNRAESDTIAVEIGDIVLNAKIDPDGINAIYEDGILKIDVPYSDTPTDKYQVRINFDDDPDS